MAEARSRPLLERQRIFASRDPDEAGAFLRGKEFRFALPRLPGCPPPLDLRINGIYLPGMYIGYIQYGAPAEVRTGPARDDYWLQLPIAEPIEFTVGRQVIACESGRAVVSSPPHGLLIRTKGSGARLNISLTAATLNRQLTGLLGATPSQPLEFAPLLDLSIGHGRSLAQHVRLAVAALERAGGLPWDEITAGLFEQFVMHRLLLSHPNNFSERLRARDRSLIPRDLRRALEFMHANLAAPITVVDIAEASGIAGRTLFQYFRDFHRTSPMRYLREARFAGVHEALRKAEPDQGVAGIAIGWGFPHPGRFAVEYRKRFGQSPSDTLRRRPRAIASN